MQINPYKKNGKTLVYLGAGIMVVSILLGATPPTWAVALSAIVTIHTYFKG